MLATVKANGDVLIHQRWDDGRQVLDNPFGPAAVIGGRELYALGGSVMDRREWESDLRVSEWKSELRFGD
jgi:hypothetical protein